VVRLQEVSASVLAHLQQHLLQLRVGSLLEAQPLLPRLRRQRQRLEGSPLAPRPQQKRQRQQRGGSPLVLQPRPQRREPLPRHQPREDSLLVPRLQPQQQQQMPSQLEEADSALEHQHRLQGRRHQQRHQLLQEGFHLVQPQVKMLAQQRIRRPPLLLLQRLGGFLLVALLQHQPQLLPAEEASLFHQQQQQQKTKTRPLLPLPQLPHPASPSQQQRPPPPRPRTPSPPPPRPRGPSLSRPSPRAAAGAGAGPAPVPAEYQAKTVDEILGDWGVRLEQDVAAFARQAARVAAWDQALREHQEALGSASDRVHRLLLGQAELDRTLDTVQAYQGELEATLGALEAQVDEQFRRCAARAPDDADLERERAYQLAVATDQRLGGVLDGLRALADDINAGFDRQVDDANPVSKILRILNAHHQSLAWLERQASGLDRELAQVGRRMQRLEATGAGPGGLLGGL